MEQMIRIFITPEEIRPEEPRMIVGLLDDGWDYAHLRHPESTLAEMRRLIESIPQRYHRRLRLHGHFALAADFNLGGLHLNRRCPQPPTFYDGPISRSCHSIEQVKQSTDCDYVTLSPIFDSISKPGYCSRFSSRDLMALNEIATPRVIALGGITPDNSRSLAGLGFSGYAVKGAIDLFIKKITT